MSPIWIPWAVFWFVTVVFIMRIFQGVSARDRAASMIYMFTDWPTSSVEHFVQVVNELDALGIANQEDKDLLAAAKIVMTARHSIKISKVDAPRTARAERG